MKKKMVFSLIIAGILALSVVFHVIAGSTFDFGELLGAPSVGEANWTAWPTLINMENGRPIEILTEDNTNCELGENLGYSEYDGDANTEWWMQVENLLTPIPTDTIQMVFGGLESYSGTLWRYSFSWDRYTYFETDHGVVPIHTTTGNACPSISAQPVEEPADSRTFVFSGPMPGATYHIYRSQNASGADNGASNGQYFWVGTVTLDPGEHGMVYTDTTEIYDGPAWYLVIEADSGTNAIIGCHSEEADPTNVVMGEFIAAYDGDKSAVVLEWETVSETNIVGFDVFRGITDTLIDSVKINTAIIPATQSGLPFGDIYTFEDADVEKGQTYYYWIEILTNDMSDQTVGPESVTIPEPTWFYYFLPLLFN